MNQHYPRDLLGYAVQPPDPEWPGGARIAVQFVVNYEEGGENCILHGDPHSEAFLSEIIGAEPWHGERHWNMETIYEYGAPLVSGDCIAYSRDWTFPSQCLALPAPSRDHLCRWRR